MIKNFAWFVALVIASAYGGLAASLAWNWNIFPVTGVLISWQSAFSGMLIARYALMIHDKSGADVKTMTIRTLAVSTAIIALTYIASMIP